MRLEPAELGPEYASEIAAFTRVAAEYDLLTTTSVRRSIFAETDPQLVVGVWEAGLEAVGVAVVRGEVGYVKFIAVHPRIRRRGVGGMLLDRLETFCASRGATSVHIGRSAPWYVVPGVDVRSSEMICMLEARGYQRRGEAVNQSVPLRDLPDPPLPVRPASDDDHERIRVWLADEYPNWLAEVAAAHRYGTLVVHEDKGFAAYDVNREGWFGPMASQGGPGGKGVGSSTLLGALHAMRRNGYERADIAWVGPVVFYAKVVGARINRVFWSYHKAVGPQIQ